MSVLSYVEPLSVVDFDPNEATADASGFAECSDGQTYVAKLLSADAMLPVTEAFCELLGAACQLPVTTGAWLRMPDGDEGYGSRWEGGLVRQLSGRNRITHGLEMNSRKRQWQRCTSPGQASALFAFDLFVFNYDRHHNNWTFHEQNGNLTARALDFSRAVWTVDVQGFAGLPAVGAMKLLPPTVERTCATYRVVKRWVGQDLQKATQMLDRLQRIPPQWVQNQLSQMPPGWISAAHIAATVAWWASPARDARIHDIRQGLSNGSLC